MDGPERTPGGSVFDRAAPTYGTVGPDVFSYFGRRLVDRMGITKNGRVLDVACGTGAALLSADEAVGAGLAVGADLSEPMLRRARGAADARVGLRAVVACMDAQQLAVRTESFDAVVSTFALGPFPTRSRHWRNVGGLPDREDGWASLFLTAGGGKAMTAGDGTATFSKRSACESESIRSHLRTYLRPWH